MNRPYSARPRAPGPGGANQPDDGHGTEMRIRTRAAGA